MMNSEGFKIPQDGGPIYTETNLDSFIIEPWNAVSSLAILFPAVYWALKLKFNYKEYPFLFLSMLLLFLGGMGSTLYHAFRNSSFLLYLDVTPSALLTVLIGVYFWFILLKSWPLTFLLIIPLTIGRFSVFSFFESETAVNISYFISGFLIFLPVLLLLKKTKMAHLTDISLSIVFLTLSLVMRESDQRLAFLLPMGSHFLWHIFSGIGAHFLARYLLFIHHYFPKSKFIKFKTTYENN